MDPKKVKSHIKMVNQNSEDKKKSSILQSPLPLNSDNLNPTSITSSLDKFIVSSHKL